MVHCGNGLGPRPRHRGDDGHFQPGRCRTPSAAAVPRRASAGHDLRTVGAEPEKLRSSGDLRRLARFNEDLERRRRHRGHRPDPDSERRRGSARVGAARKCHAIVLYGAWSDAACRPRTRSKQRVFSRSIRRWGGTERAAVARPLRGGSVDCRTDHPHWVTASSRADRGHPAGGLSASRYDRRLGSDQRRWRWRCTLDACVASDRPRETGDDARAGPRRADRDRQEHRAGESSHEQRLERDDRADAGVDRWFRPADDIARAWWCRGIRAAAGVRQHRQPDSRARGWAYARAGGPRRARRHAIPHRTTTARRMSVARCAGRPGRYRVGVGAACVPHRRSFLRKPFPRPSF